MGDVAVITVSFNTSELTQSCVASVLKSDQPDLEIIVVDNDSVDGTPAALRAQFDKITVIDSGANLGFAKACNLGAAAATSRYLLFLNPDATIAPDAIGLLREFADGNPEHGIYGGLVVDSSGEPDTSTARNLPSVWSMFCFATGLSYVRKGSRIFDPEAGTVVDSTEDRSVAMLSGAMLMVRSDVWHQLGGFDPDYFMYGEDADLCLRAAALGYQPVCIPTARAVHDSGAASSSNNKAFMKTQGQATYLRKNWTGARRRAGLWMLLAGVRLRALSRASGEQSIDWNHLWQRRSEWYPGYA